MEPSPSILNKIDLRIDDINTEINELETERTQLRSAKNIIIEYSSNIPNNEPEPEPQLQRTRLYSTNQQLYEEFAKQLINEAKSSPMVKKYEHIISSLTFTIKNNQVEKKICVRIKSDNTLYYLYNEALTMDFINWLVFEKAKYVDTEPPITKYDIFAIHYIPN